MMGVKVDVRNVSGYVRVGINNTNVENWKSITAEKGWEFIFIPVELVTEDFLDAVRAARECSPTLQLKIKKGGDLICSQNKS